MKEVGLAGWKAGREAAVMEREQTLFPDPLFAISDLLFIVTQGLPQFQ